MASKECNKEKTIATLFDNQDEKFMNLSAEKLEKIKKLPLRKEAKIWPKVTV